jgi:dolichol-phosphate mannosyltransferase
VIVPALNEGPNLKPLVQQISEALAGRSYEVLIVDDNSSDDTPAVCTRLVEHFPVRLIVRDAPKNGLSGAVLHGMAEARGGIFVVMDADLQHPPSKLPELIAAVESGDADFAVGSRYAPGGSTGEKWGLLRQLNSRIATLLARPFSGAVHDPMSGFFALRRETFLKGRRLTPLGYKIGLELMCKCRVRSVREVPIHFAERVRGESKLTLKQQFKYLEHLSRLYDFCYPRLSPMLKFIVVTIISWFTAFGVFVLLLANQLAGPAWAPTIAYLAVIAVTAVFHARYVRTQREFLVRKYPWVDFFVSSLAEWATCALVATYLAVRLEHPWDLELFFIPFSAALLVRYVMRKEFLLDVRGLRRLPRDEELDAVVQADPVRGAHHSDSP